MTAASAQAATMRGTGTAVLPSARWMSCSRTTSWAVGRTPVAGGRRNTQSAAAVRTRNVRFDAPPDSCSICSGAPALKPRAASQSPRRTAGTTRSTSVITPIVYGGK